MAASVIVFFGVSAMQNAGVSTAEAKANPKNPYGACVRGRMGCGERRVGPDGQRQPGRRYMWEIREPCAARRFSEVAAVEERWCWCDSPARQRWREGVGVKHRPGTVAAAASPHVAAEALLACRWNCLVAMVRKSLRKAPSSRVASRRASRLEVPCSRVCAVARSHGRAVSADWRRHEADLRSCTVERVAQTPDGRRFVHGALRTALQGGLSATLHRVLAQALSRAVAVLLSASRAPAAVRSVLMLMHLPSQRSRAARPSTTKCTRRCSRTWRHRSHRMRVVSQRPRRRAAGLHDAAMK
jgi:hypothetical protein